MGDPGVILLSISMLENVPYFRIFGMFLNARRRCGGRRTSRIYTLILIYIRLLLSFSLFHLYASFGGLASNWPSAYPWLVHGPSLCTRVTLSVLRYRLPLIRGSCPEEQSWQSPEGPPSPRTSLAQPSSCVLPDPRASWSHHCPSSLIQTRIAWIWTP